MKIRSDYVSNSSSSSFILHLDKPIRYYTQDEFKNLFESDQALNCLYRYLQREYGQSESRDLDFWVDYESKLIHDFLEKESCNKNQNVLECTIY